MWIKNKMSIYKNVPRTTLLTNPVRFYTLKNQRSILGNKKLLDGIDALEDGNVRHAKNCLESAEELLGRSKNPFTVQELVDLKNKRLEEIIGGRNMGYLQINRELKYALDDVRPIEDDTRNWRVLLDDPSPIKM